MADTILLQVTASMFGQIADGRLGGAIASFGADCELNIGTRVRTTCANGVYDGDCDSSYDGVVIFMPDNGEMIATCTVWAVIGRPGDTIVRFDDGTITSFNVEDRSKLFKSLWKRYVGFKCAQPVSSSVSEVAADNEIGCKSLCALSEVCGGFEYSTSVESWTYPEDTSQVRHCHCLLTASCLITVSLYLITGPRISSLHHGTASHHTLFLTVLSLCGQHAGLNRCTSGSNQQHAHC